MRYLWAFVLALLFVSGCGYKPTSHYAKELLGESVYVTVNILPTDPENAIIVKDALLQALISRFRVSVKPSALAQTKLDVTIGALTFVPIEFDANGFVVSQRCTSTFSITRTNAGMSRTYSVMGTYDFNIDPNGIVSETQRFNAIRFSSLKAVDALVSQLAVEGSRK